MANLLPEYLRALMLARGYKSSSALAERMPGCTRQHVDAWLAGTVPGAVHARSLALALGVRTDELLARCAGVDGPVPSDEP